MKSEVYFANAELKEEYSNLQTSKSEEQELYKWISRAIEDLKQNVFCGIHVKKELIPAEYIQKYNVNNLWKYDLPKGWRLLYSVGNNEITVISIILEWMTHKDYERRFNY